MPTLSDTELRMIAEVVAEMAKHRGKSFDRDTKAVAFTHAALADVVFKARLAELARRIGARRNTDMPRELVAPLKPLFRQLEEALKRIEGADAKALSARLCPSVRSV